jgi:single-stranded-DNA-specific exonuclease
MHHGLKQLNSNPSFGLRGIIEICGLTRKKITVNDIVFKIGPRINASGRIMNGKEAVDLLLATDITSARIKSKNIDKYNEDRRELDKKITDEAIAYIENQLNINGQKSIVLYNETWHKGIVGIVASRLSERYFRPTIVLTKSNNMITGSARSVPGFDVYKAIESCKDILENFGGHTYAAGLTLREENLEEFKRRFSIISFDEIEARMMQPKIRIAGEITFDKITPKFINDLALFQPFGPENENPIFLTRNVTDSGKSKLVGKNLQHIKMEIVDPTVTLPMQAIAFCQENAFPLLKEKQSVDICYTIEENTHGKNTYTQLEIKDIRKSNK